jgi:hypothetical protein
MQWSNSKYTNATEAVQEIAAEAQVPLQQPSSPLPAASFATQISAAASSAAQKMHSIATHAASWWQRCRRNHAETANSMTETAANVDGQHAEELESTAAAAAVARTEQPEASSTTAAAAERAGTHAQLRSHAAVHTVAQWRSNWEAGIPTEAP